MIRAITATMVALCIAGTVSAPVMAQEKKPEETKKETKLTSKPSNSDVNLASRLASFTTGVVFGVPVAIVRRTEIEVKQGIKDLVGDTDKWYVIGPASLLAVPYGGVSGGVGGVMYGVKNAWVGSGDEPFGKDSFSLGDNVD